MFDGEFISRKQGSNVRTQRYKKSCDYGKNKQFHASLIRIIWLIVYYGGIMIIDRLVVLKDLLLFDVLMIIAVISRLLEVVFLNWRVLSFKGFQNAYL